jgi:hypothetical protein
MDVVKNVQNIDFEAFYRAGVVFFLT